MSVSNMKEGGFVSYKWLDWAKEMQAIAQSGLTYAKDVYDQERYEQLRQLSVDILASYTELEMEKVKQLFTNEKGYQTPKVDVRAVVFKEEALLFVREKVDNKWSLPGGYCDIGLSPSENVVKEVKEEAGYEVTPIRLLAVLDSNRHPHPPQPYQYYKLFIQCEITGGQAKRGVETKDVGFFRKDELPPLSENRIVKSQIELLFEYAKNPQKDVTFD